MKWEVESKSNDLVLTCEGKIEFDGFMVYKLSLKALNELEVKDIRLEIPIKKKVANYMMGLGRREEDPVHLITNGNGIRVLPRTRCGLVM